MKMERKGNEGGFFGEKKIKCAYVCYYYYFMTMARVGKKKEKKKAFDRNHDGFRVREMLENFSKKKEKKYS